MHLRFWQFLAQRQSSESERALADEVEIATGFTKEDGSDGTAQMTVLVCFCGSRRPM